MRCRIYGAILHLTTSEKLLRSPVLGPRFPWRSGDETDDCGLVFLAPLSSECSLALPFDAAWTSLFAYTYVDEDVGVR